MAITKSPPIDSHLFNIADEIADLRQRVLMLEADVRALRQEVLALRVELANSRHLPVTGVTQPYISPTIEPMPPLPKVWAKVDSEC